MAVILMTYDFPSIPDSIQIGDTGYYASTASTAGGFSTGSGVIAFGLVSTITRSSSPPTVTFIVDNSSITPPTQGQYIMFGKNKVVNTSSLLGYYAKVKFTNNSTEYAELFSVGSEISESSK
tara:strand:+ start:203 stop:568 length:366 start_codon:yes stop_codon:yes gene_type:complete